MNPCPFFFFLTMDSYECQWCLLKSDVSNERKKISFFWKKRATRTEDWNEPIFYKSMGVAMQHYFAQFTSPIQRGVDASLSDPYKSAQVVSPTAR